MPIHPTEVRHRGFIAGAVDERFRDVGYDLTVGHIYVPKHGWLESTKQRLFGNKLLEEFEIPPQGVVVVFSAETIVLPEGVCAYAMPKTSLCSDGILVFNTGIVDPNFRGLLCGTTVNFRDTGYRLKRGDPFLRLVFESLPAPEILGDPHQSQPFSTEEIRAYELERVNKAIDFPATFLNIPETVKIVSTSVLEKERNQLLWILAIVGIVLTLLTVVPMFIPKDYMPNTPTREELDGLVKEYSKREAVDELVKDLANRIKELEDARKAGKESSPGQPAGTTPTSPPSKKSE